MIARHVERLAARLQGRRPGPPAIHADAEGLRIGGHTLVEIDAGRFIELCASVVPA